MADSLHLIISYIHRHVDYIHRVHYIQYIHTITQVMVWVA
jgi:hypothetical protein